MSFKNLKYHALSLALCAMMTCSLVSCLQPLATSDRMEVAILGPPKIAYTRDCLQGVGTTTLERVLHQLQKELQVFLPDNSSPLKKTLLPEEKAALETILLKFSEGERRLAQNETLSLQEIQDWSKTLKTLRDQVGPLLEHQAPSKSRFSIATSSAKKNQFLNQKMFLALLRVVGVSALTFESSEKVAASEKNFWPSFLTGTTQRTGAMSFNTEATPSSLLSTIQKDIVRGGNLFFKTGPQELVFEVSQCLRLSLSERAEKGEIKNFPLFLQHLASHPWPLLSVNFTPYENPERLPIIDELLVRWKLNQAFYRFLVRLLWAQTQDADSSLMWELQKQGYQGNLQCERFVHPSGKTEAYCLDFKLPPTTRGKPRSSFAEGPPVLIQRLSDCQDPQSCNEYTYQIMALE